MCFHICNINTKAERKIIKTATQNSLFLNSLLPALQETIKKALVRKKHQANRPVCLTTWLIDMLAATLYLILN